MGEDYRATDIKLETVNKSFAARRIWWRLRNPEAMTGASLFQRSAQTQKWWSQSPLG